MKSIAIFLTLALLFSSCSGIDDRAPANIFDKDDRLKISKDLYPGVGRLMKNPQHQYSWGTAFHLSPCYVASAYHVVKDTNSEITKEDQVYFISSLKEKPIMATPVAWGTPYLGELNDNDWVILKLDECLEVEPSEIFSLKNYRSIDDLRGISVELVGFPEDRVPDNIHLDKSCKFGDEEPEAGDGIGHNCATRPGNSGSPIYVVNSQGLKEVYAITVASRGYFVEIIAGYSPWISNTATPVAPVREAFKRLNR